MVNYVYQTKEISMKFDKACLVGLIAAAAMFGTSNVIAVAPPPPHGVVLAPHMVWCPRCGGWGRVPSGFLGWKDKRCPECKGAGMMYPAWYRPPAPIVAPPPPHHHHHKDVRPVPPPPRHHHHKDVRPVPPPPKHHKAVRPVPPPRPPKKGGHRGPGPR